VVLAKTTLEKARLLHREQSIRIRQRAGSSSGRLARRFLIEVLPTHDTTISEGNLLDIPALLSPCNAFAALTAIPLELKVRITLAELHGSSTTGLSGKWHS